MPCKYDKNALIEAAATGVDFANAPDSNPELSALRTHLEFCAECCAAFAQEESLFSSIDAGLQAAANAEVPESLLPRVRAQLKSKVTSRRFLAPAWVALAAAAALILVVVSVRNARISQPGKNTQTIAIARNVPPAETPTTRDGASLEPLPARGTNQQSRPKGVESAVRLDEVSVLIPAGQKQAIDTFLAGLHQGAIKLDVLLAEKPQQSLQDLQVSPLDISLLEVKPLAEVSGDASSSKNARP